MSEATNLPLTGQKWFKNSELDEVPWSLFVTSRNIHFCDKGMPVSLLKIRWHGLLAVLRQFVTCEGRYGLVFLYHIRLLMHFIGFQLNMSFYLLRRLYKMEKRYKKQSLDSSLFHDGMIKLLVVLWQFVTCECHYGLFFLYHIRLLMCFISFQLNMPFYLLRSFQRDIKAEIGFHLVSSWVN